MGANHVPSRLNAPPWLPWVLGLALFTIVGSHLVAWVNSLVVSQTLRTQQRLLSDLVQYQSLLSDLDESLRAVMLAPERADLKRQKADAILALQEHLGALAEEAPISGPIPKDLISLATHFRKKLVPQADLVQKHAAAPGPWAMERFRKDYAEVRFHHAEQVQALIEATRGLGEDSVSAGLHRLMLSAGILILLWSAFLMWLVLRVRVRGVAGLPAVLIETDPGPAPEASHPTAPALEHSPAHVTETAIHPAGNHGETAVSAAAPVAAAVPISEPTSSPPAHAAGQAPAAAAPEVDPTTPPVRPTEPPATAAPAAATSPVASLPDAGGGELGQSEIADLLRQTGTPDTGTNAATPPPVATGTAAATAAPPVNRPSVVPPAPAKEAHEPAAPTPAPTSQPAPTVLPAGPVDLSALLQEDVPAAAPPSPSSSPDQPEAVSGVPAPAMTASSVASASAAQPPVVPPASPPAAPAPPEVAAAPAAPAPTTTPDPVASVAPQPEDPPSPPAPPPPLPDIQTLMKGASAMTTEQLTAMLFGSPAPAAAKPAAPAAPPPAPAAPPRTITGSEMATTKPGEEPSGVVDLSF